MGIDRIPTESSWWQYVRDHLPGLWLRIEDKLRKGTPDVFGGTIEHRFVLIELKVMERPKLRMGLSKGQLAFHKGWAARGGLSYVLARVGGRVVLLRGNRCDGDRRWCMSRAMINKELKEVDWTWMSRAMSNS